MHKPDAPSATIASAACVGSTGSKTRAQVFKVTAGYLFRIADSLSKVETNAVIPSVKDALAKD